MGRRGICWFLGVVLWLSLGTTNVQAGPAETVLNWVLSQVDAALPGTLSYDKLTASLGGPVILEGVRYEDGPLVVSVRQFELALDISVFSRSVTLNRLQAYDVDVRLPPPAADSEPPSDEPFSLSDISLPVALDIRQIAVRNISILPFGGETPFIINQVNLQARTEGEAIQVETAQVVAPQGKVDLEGELTPVGQYPLDLQLVWDWTVPEAGSYAGRGSLSGDLATLRLTQVVSGALRGEIRATVNDALGDPGWNASINALVPDLGVYQADYQGRELRVQLQSEGTLADYQASLTLASGALPEVGEVEADLVLSGGSTALKISTLQLTASQSAMALQAEADIDLDRQVLDASGSWQSLAWPLTGEPQVASPEGDFQLAGTLDDFRFGLDTLITGAQLGRLRLGAQGQGDRQRVALSSLRLSAEESPLSVELAGQLGLADLDFDVQGSWDAITIPLAGAEPQVEISAGSLAANGTPDDYRASLDTRVSGPALGILDAALRLTGDADTLLIDSLDLTRPDGDLQVQLNGRYGLASQQFQAQATVAALALPLVGEPAITIPTATLHAEGTPSDYRARLDAGLQGPALGELQALIEASGSQVALTLDTLRLDRPGSDLAMVVNGRYGLGDQRFQLDGEISALPVPLVGEPALTIPAGELSASGTPDDYQATLNLGLEGTATGELQALIQASGDSQAVSLDTLRLSREGSDLLVNLAATFGFTDQQFTLDGDINALPVPLDGEPALTIPTGSISASGTPADYRATLQAALSGAATGELQALIQASGDTSLLRLETLQVNREDSDLAVVLDGQFDITDQRFALAGEINALPIPLSGEPALTIPSGELSVLGTPADYQARLGLALSGSATGELQALIQASGDTGMVRLETLRVDRPGSDLVVALNGSFEFSEQRFALDGDIGALPIPLSGEPALTIPTGTLSARGTPADYQARVALALSGSATGELQALIEANGDDQAATLNTLRLSREGSDLLVDLGGSFGFADQRFNVTGDINALPLPLSGEPALTIPTGELSAEGTPADYQARISLDLEGEATGELQALIEANGDDQAATLNTLKISREGSDLLVDLGGSFGFADQRFALRGDINALPLPLSGEPALTIPTGELSAEGTPADYQARVALALSGSATGELQALIEANGDDQAATLNTLKISREGSDLLVDLGGSFGFADQRFSVTGDINALPLPLSGEPALTIPTGELSAEGTPADYQARISLDLEGEATGELQALIEADGDDQAATLNTLKISREGSELLVDLAGSFGFADQRFSVTGDINALPLPLSGEPALTIPTGELSAEGTPADYQATISLDLEGEATGELQALIEASGDDRAATLETLRLSREGSELLVDLGGSFGFTDLQFTLNGDINALPVPLSGDPALTIPTGELSASGTPSQYQARVALGLSGDATGELQALIEASGTDQAATLDTLRLSREGSELRVDLGGSFGFADQRFTVDGDINALPIPLAGEPALTIPTGELSASGTPADFGARLVAALRGPQFGDLQATLTAGGDTQQVNITELALRQADGPFVLGGQASLSLADIGFQSELDWEGFRWPLVGAEPQLFSPDGALRASGTPSDYEATVVATLLGPEDQSLDARVVLTGSDQQVDISTLSLQSPGDGPRLGAQAQVVFQPLSFQAQGDWAALVWPLSGDPQVQSPDGNFRAQGDLQAYTFDLSTRVSGPAIPETTVDLAGEGTGEALETANLRAGLLGGEVNADLGARWAPALGWQADLRGQGLDIGSFYPEFPGVVGFALSSEGSSEDDTLRASVDIASLDGSIRDQALAGSGRIELQGQTLIIQGLSLGAGEAQVDIDGRLAEELALDWRLVANLAALVPEFQGRVQGQGSLAGTREVPRVEANLDVAGLAAAGVAVDSLDLQALVDLSGASASQLNLQGQGIVAGGQTITGVELSGDGTPDNHRVTLQAGTQDFGSLSLGLAGGLDQDNVWDGNLGTLTLADTPGGTWELAGAAPLRAGASAASLGDACLRQSPAEVCISGNWGAQEGASARIALAQLTAALAGDRLPENLTVDTALGGELTFQSDADGRYQAQVDLNLDPGRVVTQVSGNPLEIPLTAGGIQASADNDRVDGELSLNLGELGDLGATVAVSALGSRPQVDGNLQAAIRDLSMVEIVVPQLTGVDGRVEADISVQGSPPVLDLGGSLALRDAATDVPQVSIQLRELNLAANGVGSETLALDGSVRSGDGELRFGGELAPLEGRVALTIQGENFQVMNTADIQATASPDLLVDVSPEAIRVTGEIRIPMAHISPPELQESGVRPSSDVVIVRESDGTEVAPPGESGAPIYARVRVILGDDVRVSAAGFEGKLEGNLEVEQQPGLAPRGSGSVAVASGQYRIAGQEIEIERGRILFGGGPVTQPGLDLRVVRESDGVSAGAQVSGPVTDPNISLFSSPAMPDSSILSYLVFGRAPDTRASGENALLLSAVTGGSSLVTQSLGSQVGLDDFRLVGDGTNEASFLVGKYITPELWVGYGVGLLNAVNEFLVRYELTENIDLEANTSEEGTGGDITYTIER